MIAGPNKKNDFKGKASVNEREGGEEVREERKKERRTEYNVLVQVSRTRCFPLSLREICGSENECLGKKKILFSRMLHEKWAVMSE